MKFKVGDRVKIKSWNRMVKEFGMDHSDIDCRGPFTSTMKYLCGLEGVITAFETEEEGEVPCYVIIDNPIIKRSVSGRMEPYHISTDMIYKCRKRKETAQRAPNDIRVGDRVRFKTWEEMQREYGGSESCIDCAFAFTDSMRYLCGTEATVTRIGGDGQLFLNPATFWSISTDMVRRID